MNPTDSPTAPRSAPFQFSLRALLAWILWFGLCVAAAVAADGVARELAIVVIVYSAMALALVIHHVLDMNKQRSGRF